MAATTPEPRADAVREHRRQVRREIWLPALGGLVLILLITLLSGTLPRGIQTSLVADFMGTLLILCPAAICLFPVYLLMVFAVVGMNRVYGFSAKSLRSLETFSERLMQRTYNVGDRLARMSIGVNARLAPLDRFLFSAFDRPKDQQDQPPTLE